MEKALPETFVAPFCPASAGSCVNDPLNEVLERVERFGCHAYPPARDSIARGQLLRPNFLTQ